MLVSTAGRSLPLFALVQTDNLQEEENTVSGREAGLLVLRASQPAVLVRCCWRLYQWAKRMPSWKYKSETNQN